MRLEPVMEDAAVLNRYVGKYEGEGQVTNIRMEGGSLLISPYPDFWVNAYFTSDTDFFVREFNGDLKFIIDADGKVTGFSIGGMLVPKVQ